MTNFSALHGFALFLGFCILALTLPQLINKPFHQFNMQTVQLEWERDPNKAKEIIGKMGRDRTLRDLKLDSWVVVPLYIALFIWLAFHLKTVEHPLGPVLFFAIIVTILIAGVFDLFENYYTARVVTGQTTQSLLDMKYYACFLKWALIAAALLLVSVAFLLRGNTAVALTGFATVVVFVLSFIAFRPLVQWGFVLMGVTFLMIGFFR